MAPTISAEQARERINAALDAIDAAHDELRETSSDLAGNMFRVDVAARLETQERANRGLMYRFFAEIADPPDEAGSTAAVRSALWARLRITPNEITRRFKLAARIRPRRSLTGPPLPPELPELAAAVEAGVVGDDHIRSVCRAIDVLPGCVSPDRHGGRGAHAGRTRRQSRRRHRGRNSVNASPTTSTPMACSATRTGPAAAACISASRVPTACRG